MKFIYILLLNFGLLNISCINIIGKEEEIIITNGLSTDKVFIKLYNFSNAAEIYVMLEIRGGIIEDYINIKFSNFKNIDDNNFSDYKYFLKNDTNISKTNYYQIDYKEYNYMVLKYHIHYFNLSATNYLKVKATDKNPQAGKNKILLIIIGSVFFLLIAIGIINFIYNIYKCLKKKEKNTNTNEVTNEINPSSIATSQESFVNKNNNNHESNENNEQHFPEYPKPY